MGEIRDLWIYQVDLSDETRALWPEVNESYLASQLVLSALVDRVAFSELEHHPDIWQEFRIVERSYFDEWMPRYERLKNRLEQESRKQAFDEAKSGTH